MSPKPARKWGAIAGAAPLAEQRIVRAAAAVRGVTPSQLVRALVVPAARAVLMEAGQDPDALPSDLASPS